nr:unnamed protein product [Callosobruchus analis]
MVKMGLPDALAYHLTKLFSNNPRLLVEIPAYIRSIDDLKQEVKVLMELNENASDSIRILEEENKMIHASRRFTCQPKATIILDDKDEKSVPEKELMILMPASRTTSFITVPRRIPDPQVSETSDVITMPQASETSNITEPQFAATGVESMYKWTHQNTLLLLDLYKKYKTMVTEGRIRLKKLYECKV